MSAAAATTRIPCPRCGGPVGMLDGADGLICPHCAARYFVGEQGANGWLLSPSITFQDAILAARRFLREQGQRVTRIGDATGLLVPVYWLRGTRLTWQLRPIESGLAASTRPRTERETLELREHAFLGDRMSVRAEAHTFPGHELSRFWPGGAMRFSGRTLDVLDPDRLPSGYQAIRPTMTRDEASAHAEHWRAWKHAGDVSPARERTDRMLRERMNLVLVPLVVVEFAFGDARSGVVVDGISGRALGFTSSPPQLPEWGEATAYPTTRPHLIPLECVECGWELPLRERDRIHPCPNCGLAWELSGARIRAVRQWMMHPEPGARGIRLPFWVFGTDASESMPPDRAVYVPAYVGRHAEAQLRLGVALTHQPPQGECELPLGPEVRGATLGSQEAKAWRWAIEARLSGESRARRLKLLQSPMRDEPPAGLVWLSFVREGGDLVQLNTQQRVRISSTRPWAELRAA